MRIPFNNRLPTIVVAQGFHIPLFLFLLKSSNVLKSCIIFARACWAAELLCCENFQAFCFIGKVSSIFVIFILNESSEHVLSNSGMTMFCSFKLFKLYR